MGNKPSQVVDMIGKKDYFLIERAITPTLTVGVTKVNNSENPYSHQGIRYKEQGDIHRLQSVKEYTNCLEYNFEKEVQLTLCKMKNNDVILTLKTPESGSSIEKVHPSIQKIYKTISMDSKELDQMEKIMK